MPSLFQLAVMLPAFKPEIRADQPAWPVLQTTAILMAPLAKLCGYRATHPYPSRPDATSALVASDGQKHGYALLQDIEAFAGVRLGPGTLWGAISRLEERGLIAAVEAPGRRRPYRLSSAGAEALRSALAELRMIVDEGSAVSAERLTKRCGSRRGVQDVRFTVGAGHSSVSAPKASRARLSLRPPADRRGGVDQRSARRGASRVRPLRSEPSSPPAPASCP
jgi:DNA-binding PadR family transcriptional regulator